MGAENLALMARLLGMQPRFLAQQARDMTDRVPTAIDQAAREIAPSLTPSARTLAERKLTSGRGEVRSAHTPLRLSASRRRRAWPRVIHASLP